MPFDPKIIAADEPPLTADGEIDLPVDLAGLSQQLSDDASHLASRYPAARSPAINCTTGSKRQIRVALAIAGLFGSIVAASLLGIGIVHFGQHPAMSTDRSGSVEQSSFVSAIAPPQTISLSELSQPELEAALDLMEREPNTTSRVSF